MWCFAALRKVISSHIRADQLNKHLWVSLLAYLCCAAVASMATSDQPLDEIVTNSKPTSKEEWFNSLQKAIEDGKAFRRQHKIQRVAKLLRDKNQDCFEPIAVSIGPYHRNKPHLQRMEKLKAPMLGQYVEALDCTTKELLYHEVEKVAAKARECYAEDATEGMSDEDFTRMMFLDGCFFLQFIMCGREGIQMTRSDRVCVERDLFLLENQLPFIVLKALSGSSDPEEKMMKFISTWPHHQPIEEKPSRMRDFNCNPQRKKEQSNAERENEQSKTEGEPIHLLQLLRQSLLINPEDLQGKRSGHSALAALAALAFAFAAAYAAVAYAYAAVAYVVVAVVVVVAVAVAVNSSVVVVAVVASVVAVASVAVAVFSAFVAVAVTSAVAVVIVAVTVVAADADADAASVDAAVAHTYRSATELKKVGISFQKSQSHRFTDVGFRNNLGLLRIHGELRLPPMFVGDHTKSRLLNLVAYEMCADVPEEASDVTSYLCFLDALIDSAEDVMELRSNGILINHLGSDPQLADLFNQIGDGLVANHNVYAGVNEQIEKHYTNKFKRMVLERLYTHFKAPWSRLSFVGALAILVLTFIQAFYAVKQGKKDKNIK